MSAVVLTGSAGALGRRVAAGLAASTTFDRVVCLDMVTGGASAPPGCTEHRVDLLVDDLDPFFDGASTLVHLASVVGPDRDSVDAGRDVELARRVLAAADRAGIRHVVIMSSATAYGARPDNPVPLTEDMPLAADTGFVFADDKVEIERMATELGARRADLRIAILRPTTTIAEGEASWVAAALTAAVGVRAGEVDPPVQFLHFDDLASATVLVAEHGCDGVYNVAPDGWIPPDQMRALSGVPRPRVPAAVARVVAAVRWRLGISPAPPQVLPWVMHPWVIANDRLRAEGWEPAYTNEEAYVAGTAPGPLQTLSPKRRQELALGAVGLLAVLGMIAAVLGVRRLRRRARG
jgi:nucleoside-diphosphate-sugar epimerase